MSLAFEMKTLNACERGLIQKVMTHNLWQNENFEKGDIQIDILHVMLNVLSTFTV